MEGVFAFFAESSFLGLFLFGERRVGPVLHWLSSVMVALGAVALGVLHRRHQRLDAASGRLPHRRRPGGADEPVGAPHEPLRPLAVPARHLGIARRGVDGHGGHRRVLPARAEARGRGPPVRPRGRDRRADLLASCRSFRPGRFTPRTSRASSRRRWRRWRGCSRRRPRAGMAIIGMPDSEQKQLIDPIVVPGVLSYLVYGDVREHVVGLNDIPEDQHPPVEIVYYAYHIMVGLGTIFIAVFATLGVPVVARPALRVARRALGADARDAVSVHREPRGLGGRRGRPPAVDRLRPAAIGGRDVAQRDRRHDVLHALRVHGAVRARRVALPAAVPAHRARRARAGRHAPRARAASAHGAAVAEARS